MSILTDHVTLKVKEYFTQPNNNGCLRDGDDIKTRVNSDILRFIFHVQTTIAIFPPPIFSCMPVISSYLPDILWRRRVLHSSDSWFVKLTLWDAKFEKWVSSDRKEYSKVKGFWVGIYLKILDILYIHGQPTRSLKLGFIYTVWKGW